MVEPGTATTSPVYRAAYSASGFPDLSSAGIETCLDLFERSCERFPSRECLGERPVTPSGQAGPFQFLTYSQAGHLVTQVGSAFSRMGLRKGDRVGVLGANCPQWMITLQGINRQGLVCVPLYETLGDNAIQYILQHSGALLVVTAAAKLPALAKALSHQPPLPLPGGVVYWGTADLQQVEALEARGYSVLSWDQMVTLGSDKGLEPPTPPTPTDLCTIMYTSGTTGPPKGVMMAHRAIITTVASVQQFLAACAGSMGPGGLRADDVYISYLTLAHIFGRVVEEALLHVGASIGYWRGDARLLLDDVAVLRPTLFAAVPRILERVYKAVTDKVAKGGALASSVFRCAYGYKRRNMELGWPQHQACWLGDRVVFSQVAARLGGRVRCVMSGASPLAPAMEEFLRVTLCAPVVQGYGLTETCAASFITQPDVWEQRGTVGPPQPSIEFRLEAVPELGYSPTDDPPRGEVCLRGPDIFSGYYKDDALTKEAIDSDGFFHTGDIGELVAGGALRIIDRKKNIMKLSHGEYIALEKVEGVCKACPGVDQVWVYGDSTQACLVAVVVPTHHWLEAWAAEQSSAPHLQGKDLQALCGSREARADVLSVLTAHGRASKLNGLELVKAVYLEHEAFSVDNDLMTPSFKLKRPQLLKHYKRVVHDMYAALAAPQGPA